MQDGLILLNNIRFSAISSPTAGPTIKFEHPKVSGTEGSVFCFHLIAVGPFEEDFAVRVNLVPQTARMHYFVCKQCFACHAHVNY